MARTPSERRGLSRRLFLGTSAMGSALVLGACGDSSSEANPVDTGSDTRGGDGGTDSGGDANDAGDSGISAKVVIVGGGIAGLHCAYRLGKAGVRADLYEAAKTFGGRMVTDRTTFPGGQHCELGGELIDTGHETMHALAKELGIELLDYDTDDATLAKVVGYIDGAKQTEADIIAAFDPAVSAKIDDALTALKDATKGVDYKDANGGEKLDAMSIDAFLDSAGATGMIRKLLAAAFLGEYGLETNVSNALNLLLLISTDTSAGFQVFGDSDERFHTKTGNATFVEKLAAAVPADSLHTELRLTALAPSSDGGYVLTFDKGGTSTEVKAAHVVLAIPFSILRDVKITVDLPAVKKTAIAELGYGMNSKVMAGFATRPWRTVGKSNGGVYSNMAMQETWETSRLQPGDTGIVTSFLGGSAAVAATTATSDAALAAFLADYDKVFAGAKAASNGKVARGLWPTNPFVKASYSAYLVGQYTKFSGAEGEAVGNLHFCGEHTSTAAQGYMEGGAESGARAAQEVLDVLGVKTAAAKRMRRARSRMLSAMG